MDMMDQSIYGPASCTEHQSLGSPKTFTTGDDESHLELPHELQSPRPEYHTVRRRTEHLLLTEGNTGIIESGFNSSSTTKSVSSDLHVEPYVFSERHNSTRDASEPNVGIQAGRQKLANRRTQSRDAQRRFRERRDEINKSLQTEVAELQEALRKLSDELTKKSAEVAQLRCENEGLRMEVYNLQQRWRSVILLLQRPKTLQLISMLIEEEQV